MTRPIALACLALVLTLPALPAAARDFVQDQAGMFSASTVSSLNQRIGNFNAQTGKEIVVMTVPSLGNASLQSAAQTAFSQQNVNGVLIFIARDDRRDIIVPDSAGVQAGWFPPDVTRSIRSTMESQFHSEDYDAGITSAVDGVLNVYRTHLGSLRRPSSSAGAPMTKPNAAASTGVHLSMFWWIIIIVVGFLILRAIMRAMSTPRYYGTPGAPPGTPGATPPPGYGPGYGGYGGYGGGGSFWSGLLGGLGGAWLGNEMFGNRGGSAIGPADAGQASAPDAGGGWSGGGDAGGGWQSDAGQAGMSGASGGDWSGGGFGDGGGFGGGDGGGGGFGGGDSGGGW